MPAWFLATLSWTVLFRPTTQQISVLAFPPQGCEGYRDYRRYIPHRQPINKYFMLSFPRICLKIETNALYAGTQHMPVFKLVKDFVWGAVLLLLVFFYSFSLTAAPEWFNEPIEELKNEACKMDQELWGNSTEATSHSNIAPLCFPTLLLKSMKQTEEKRKELDRERQMVVLAGGYLDQLSEECKGSSLHQLQLVKNEVFPSFGTVQFKSWPNMETMS